MITINGYEFKITDTHTLNDGNLSFELTGKRGAVYYAMPSARDTAKYMLFGASVFKQVPNYLSGAVLVVQDGKLIQDSDRHWIGR